MDHNDELLITYGVGLAFKKTKLLGILELETKTVSENQVNIHEEINILNQLGEEFREKCALDFPKSYIKVIEDILEEELTSIMPLIVSIKYKNDSMNEHKLMEKYRKYDLMQMRFSKEGYKLKNLSQVKEYLDKKLKTIGEISEHEGQILRAYDKLILKFILTSAAGHKFANFVNKNGEANYQKDNNKIEKNQLKHKIKNSAIINKNYNELDFLNLVLTLEEWQKKHFIWDGEYTSLMFLIDDTGNRDLGKSKQVEIKDFMISFLKGQRYLYFPFARYDNNDDVLITLNNEKYFRDNKNKKLYKSLSSKKENIDENNSIHCICDCLNTYNELGYLLSYKDEIVDICPVNYNKKNNKIDILNRHEHFKDEMIEALNKYYIR